MNHPRLRTPAGIALLAALCLAGCATSLGDQLGTRVEGLGRQLVLAWVPEHAWDAQLTQRGVTLYAEYRTASQGLVSERIASGRGAGQRVIRLGLPETLRSTPTGPVCLVLQLDGQSTLLPVRRAQAGQDAVRMRHASWEAGLAERTDRRVLQQQAQSLAAQVGEGEQQLAALRAQAERQRSVLARGGAATADACASLRAAGLPTQTPYDVLPLAQHDDTARRVCVHRVRNGTDRLESARARHSHEVAVVMAIDRRREPQVMPTVVEGFLRQSAPATDAAMTSRRDEGAQFARDWQRWRPHTGKDYLPHAGAPEDRLELTAAAADLNARFLLQQLAGSTVSFADGTRGMTPRDQLALVGGMLDAYGGCVADVRKQLATKLEAWATLQRDGPQRERLRNEFVVNQCRADHQALKALDDRIAALEADIARARSEAASRSDAAARVTVATPASPTAPIDLNSATCVR